MTQRDGFASGFLAGTLVGSIVGGLVGALVASQRASVSAAEDVPPTRPNASLVEAKSSKGKRRPLKVSSSDASIEAARRSLEDKIAQLNETIDEVRLTLGDVNGNQLEGTETLTRDP